MYKTLACRIKRYDELKDGREISWNEKEAEKSLNGRLMTLRKLQNKSPVETPNESSKSEQKFMKIMKTTVQSETDRLKR